MGVDTPSRFYDIISSLSPPGVVAWKGKRSCFPLVRVPQQKSPVNDRAFYVSASIGISFNAACTFRNAAPSGYPKKCRAVSDFDPLCS